MKIQASILLCCVLLWFFCFLGHANNGGYCKKYGSRFHDDDIPFGYSGVNFIQISHTL